MPRRDVVLTGLIAFGAGVAVGANWKKLGKEAAPLLEKLGLKMSDLADFLAMVTKEEASVKTAQAKASPSPSRKKKTAVTPEPEVSAPTAAKRNGNGIHAAPVRPSVKRKAVRSKAVAAAQS